MRRNSGQLQLSQIQRIVLRGTSLRAAEFHFFRVTDAAAARRFIGRLSDVVATADAPRPDRMAISVAFSYPGLAALGVPVTSLASFPDAFRMGMAARASAIGDSGPEAPDKWEYADSPPPHVLIWIAGKPSVIAMQSAQILPALHDGFEPAMEPQHAEWLPGERRREHFGFADALSQPRVMGITPDQGRAPSSGRDAADPPLHAGEFVIGYPDEERVLPPAPQPAALGRNGSFLVYRKLEQDVPEFRKMLCERSQLLGPDSKDLLAAKLVGRWPDGAPLVLSPRRPNASLAADLKAGNAFGYGDDLDGWRCPIGAHIRRANPRDSLGFDGQLVKRHRMIRRGIPYGPELPADADADDEERGLIFVAFVADIARQFEFVQAHWLGDGNSFGLGSDRDPLVGSSSPRFMVSGRPPHFTKLPSVVTLRWGQYLFAPGIAALRWISELSADAEYGRAS